VNLSKKTGSGDMKVELQIAPLIDVVFLLLIYFMVTASLIKKEGDISFVLPANVPAKEMVDLPVEALIFITENGTVMLDGLEFLPNDLLLDELAVQVKGLKQIADSQRSDFFVTVTPNLGTVHTRVVDVMDACAAAGVEKLSFGKGTM
jgi:biopolymer transport protein ExbD